MKATALILASCLLAACATQKKSEIPPGWTKPGASDAQMEAEAAECRGKAAAIPNNSEATTAIATVHCLVTKGWRQAR
jgi:hypothetical protein